MNELEAVQMLLRAIGSSPVNSLSSAHPDVANARATLERLRKSVQKRGWWFNEDYNVIYQPNELGEIRIPQEITRFIGEEARFVKRGRRVYDSVNQTFYINQNVTALKTIRALEWDDMPASIQEYAAYLACADFINDEVEDGAKEDKFLQKAGLAKIEVDAEDLQSARVNVYNNARVLRARGGVQPYNRSVSLRPNPTR